MADHKEEVFELFFQAHRMPYGDAKTEILRRAADIADRHQDLELAYEARRELIGATLYNGRLDEMFVHLAWCRGISEKHPDQFPVESIIWQHKWAAENIHDFPAITLEKIEEVHADFQQLLESHRFNLRPWFKIRYNLARHLGDEAGIDEYFRAWRNTPRDEQSDCVACDLNTECAYHYETRDWQAGLRVIAPVFARQETCIHEPENCWSMSLGPSAVGGQWKDVHVFLRSAMRGVHGQTGFSFARYHLVGFLAAVGAYGKAIRIWTPYTRDTQYQHQTTTRNDFALVSAELFRRQAEAGIDTVRMHLSSDLPYYREDATYPTAELAAMFQQELEETQAAFDQRNGNDAFSRHNAKEIADLALYADAAAKAGKAAASLKANY